MSSALYLHPGGKGPLRTIAIPDAVKVSDLQEALIGLAGTTANLHGAQSFVRIGTSDQITLAITNFSPHASAANGQLLRQIQSLETHLKAGHLLAVALYTDRCWCGFWPSTPAQGATTLHYPATLMPDLGTASGVIAGTDLRILDAPPDGWREVRQISSVAGSGTARQITLDEGVWYPYATAPFVLADGFWPLLQYAGSVSTPLVTHDYRRVYSFAAELRLHWPSVESLRARGGAMRFGTVENPIGLTMDDLRRGLARNQIQGPSQPGQNVLGSRFGGGA